MNVNEKIFKKTNKILDASTIINIIEKCDFKELFNRWGDCYRYNLIIPTEINDEIQRTGRDKLDLLIENCKIKVLPMAPTMELEKIQKRYPRLSLQDCTIIYHCLRLKEKVVCLTDDGPLRRACETLNIEIHGTFGIYTKLLNDGKFSSQTIKDKFKVIIQDKRINPHI
ncbi:MAG: hypothetical protein ACTSXP_17455 [Promethearchaeota archaeon]